tara:strand:+ start:300 stop:542 length:243 start_codon:yes stop_codon:yes gene_type:complete
MVNDNFFSQPVGRAVLYLNDFHFGANLSKLNRAARLVPKDVKVFASIVSMMSTHEVESNAEHVSAIIDELVFLADQIEPQ